MLKAKSAQNQICFWQAIFGYVHTFKFTAFGLEGSLIFSNYCGDYVHSYISAWEMHALHPIEISTPGIENCADAQFG
jgi:hypothetical protein